MQPAQQESHVWCLLRGENQGVQPVVDNMHKTSVEQVVLSSHKILSGSHVAYATVEVRGRAQIT